MCVTVKRKRSRGEVRKERERTGGDGMYVGTFVLGYKSDGNVLVWTGAWVWGVRIRARRCSERVVVCTNECVILCGRLYMCVMWSCVCFGLVKGQENKRMK